MSLNAAQRARTAQELQENLTLSGLDVTELFHVARLDERRTAAAIEVGGANPADVWLVRDVLETAVRQAGKEPVTYSALTEAMRAAAGSWFGVRDRR